MSTVESLAARRRSSCSRWPAALLGSRDVERVNVSEAAEQRFAIVSSLALALLTYQTRRVLPPAAEPPPHPVIATPAATARTAALTALALVRRARRGGGCAPLERPALR